jgi:hypothetical protein
MVHTHIFADDAFPADLESQAVCFIRMQWPFVFQGQNRLAKRVRSEHDPAHETAAHVVVEEERVLMSYATIIRTRITAKVSIK